MQLNGSFPFFCSIPAVNSLESISQVLSSKKWEWRVDKSYLTLLFYSGVGEAGCICSTKGSPEKAGLIPFHTCK